MACGCEERRRKYRAARSQGLNPVDASLEMLGLKPRRRGDKKAAARAARAARAEAAEAEARARRVAQEEEPEHDDEQPAGTQGTDA